MKPETVARVIDAVSDLWSLDADAEITLEANPGSVEAARFRGYRAAGVNRVSLGVQSLRDDALKALGRIHSVEEAKAAVALSQNVFDRSSFDLIYARPQQSLEAWRDELKEAVAMADGGHLSLYQLTIEPETPFAKLHALGKLVVPDPERALAMYDVTQEIAVAAGMPAYEISNHARAGEESQHNLIYWRYGEYVGVGPGAHGRILVDGARVATMSERHPETWVERIEADGHGFVTCETLGPGEQADEILLMGLRLSEGLDTAVLASVTGMRIAGDAIDELSGQGLVEVLADGRRIRATGEGRFILNEIVYRLSLGLEAIRSPCGEGTA